MIFSESIMIHGYNIQFNCSHCLPQTFAWNLYVQLDLCGKFLFSTLSIYLCSKTNLRHFKFWHMQNNAKSSQCKLQLLFLPTKSHCQWDEKLLYKQRWKGARRDNMIAVQIVFQLHSKSSFCCLVLNRTNQLLTTKQRSKTMMVEIMYFLWET